MQFAVERQDCIYPSVHRGEDFVGGVYGGNDRAVNLAALRADEAGSGVQVSW